MNDRQNANLNMYQSVLNVLDSNKSKYDKIPVFNSAAVELREKIAAIMETEQERSEIKVPASTSEKQEIKESMVQLALIVARITHVYAFDTGNQALQYQTNATKSLFYNLHDHDELRQARTIASKARENLEALTDYGMDEAMITSLEEAADRFETVIVKPRSSINEHKGQTEILKQLFADTNSLLIDRMDKMMSLFKLSDPDFYNAYFYARNVINTAYRKRKES